MAMGMGTGMGTGMAMGIGTEMAIGTRYQKKFSFISSRVSSKSHPYPVSTTATYTSLNNNPKVSTHRTYSWHPKYYWFISNTMTVYYMTDYIEKQ
jgi:hypothetical protein